MLPKREQSKLRVLFWVTYLGSGSIQDFTVSLILGGVSEKNIFFYNYVLRKVVLSANKQRHEKFCPQEDACEIPVVYFILSIIGIYYRDM